MNLKKHFPSSETAGNSTTMETEELKQPSHNYSSLDQLLLTTSRRNWIALFQLQNNKNGSDITRSLIKVWGHGFETHAELRGKASFRVNDRPTGNKNSHFTICVY